MTETPEPAELTHDERDAIEALKRRGDRAPSRSLETRTIETLRSLGLVRAHGAGRWLVAAAAFFIGTAVGAMVVPTSAPGHPGYVLFLHAGNEPNDAESQERVAEYARWAEQLRADGVEISGERLAGEARVVGGGTHRAMDIRGFFLFDVDSDARALEIAASCPHLSYDGFVTLGTVGR